MNNQVVHQAATLHRAKTQSTAKRFVYRYGTVMGAVTSTAFWAMDRLHVPSWGQWIIGMVSALVVGMFLRRYITFGSSKP